MYVLSLQFYIIRYKVETANLSWILLWLEIKSLISNKL